MEQKSVLFYSSRLLDNEPRERRKRRDPIVHCKVLLRSLHHLNKLKVINYPFEIPLDTQHDLLSETILFGGDLYRRLGD